MYVFIDASNLWAVQKTKGRFFNLENLSQFLGDTFNAKKIKVFYYAAYPADGTRKYSLEGKHKFFVYLKKGLGFAVIKKELKRIHVSTEDGEHIQEKGNMDVEITIDALHHIQKYNTAALFSGDADFLALVKYLHHRNKKVFIFSSRNNVSQELRTAGDAYFDVLSLGDGIWGKEIQHRKHK